MTINTTVSVGSRGRRGVAIKRMIARMAHSGQDMQTLAHHCNKRKKGHKNTDKSGPDIFQLHVHALNHIQFVVLFASEFTTPPIVANCGIIYFAVE